MFIATFATTAAVDAVFLLAKKHIPCFFRNQESSKRGESTGATPSRIKNQARNGRDTAAGEKKYTAQM